MIVNVSDTMIQHIDALGKPCPMPLLLLKKALKRQDSAHCQLLLKASDPHSQQDVLRYCQIHQISCKMAQISEHEYHYLIES